MADRVALARLGMTLGAITAAVVLMAALAVGGHVEGWQSGAAAPTVFAVASAPLR